MIGCTMFAFAYALANNKREKFDFLQFKQALVMIYRSKLFVSL